LTPRKKPIMVYQPQLVPDLLQVPEYTHAVAEAVTGVSAYARDKLAEAMLIRRLVILEDRRPGLAVVLGEGALHALVESAKVMSAQLSRLSELTSGNSQVTVQVVPFTSGVPTVASSGPFTILRFADTPGLGMVHVAGLPGQGGICLDSMPDVACYLQAFTQLKTSALTPSASARLLDEVAASQRTLAAL
jgi:hypothetical protein